MTSTTQTNRTLVDEYSVRFLMLRDKGIVAVSFLTYYSAMVSGKLDFLVEKE